MSMELSSGSRRRTPHDWRVMFEEWKTSGLTQAEFCANRGLSIHVFRAARYRRRESGARHHAGSNHAAKFVPVRVAPTQTGSGLVLLRPAVAVLELVLAGGRVVRIPSGFDENALARVIAVVEGRTC